MGGRGFGLDGVGTTWLHTPGRSVHHTSQAHACWGASEGPPLTACGPRAFPRALHPCFWAGPRPLAFPPFFQLFPSLQVESLWAADGRRLRNLLLGREGLSGTSFLRQWLSVHSPRGMVVTVSQH